MKLFLHITLNSEARKRLCPNLPSIVEIVTEKQGISLEVHFKQFADCEIAFGNIPADWLKKSLRLKWLQLESVGFDAYSEIIPEFN